MYIRDLRVRNYLVHQDTAVSLSPLTVFVGPHGGGKSALFDAMLNFSMVSRGNLRQAFGPYPYSFRATIHRAASKVSRIGYKVSLARSKEANEFLVYEIDYAQTGTAEDEPTFSIPHERVTNSLEMSPFLIGTIRMPFQSPVALSYRTTAASSQPSVRLNWPVAPSTRMIS